MTSHIHLIGIGGTGLSAIARVLHESGFVVSGSDRQISPLAAALRADGVQVFEGHNPAHIDGATLVVRSSAVPDDNVEVRAAFRKGVPVLKRAGFLGQLMSGRVGIAIAGTHGKTTTTSMIAWMLTDLGQAPSFIVGGVVANLGTNARAGSGRYFVIEADEYDQMFLGLRPTISVVTNVEHDHPDCFPTPEDFTQAFRDFVGRLTPDGTLLACADDPGAAALLREAGAAGRRTFAYGLGDACDLQARSLIPRPGSGYIFDLYHQNEFQVRVDLRVPGIHNVLNALAATGVGHAVGMPFPKMARSLGAFRGAGRRFDVQGEAAGVTVVDDYAHHPTEIRATIAAARARYPERRLWVVWQPHTYSRTQMLFDEFAASFEGADHVIVTSVYAARETAPEGFSTQSLADAISHPNARYIPALSGVAQYLPGSLQAGDVLLTLSAGDANRISQDVLETLRVNSV
ncbi:MAG: UDP-N-acetylmuramate--L-alanine ligase [Anaerolineales bacterium]